MLTILDISKNHIGHRGAHYLADALLNNRVLVQLNLSSNQIEDQGVEELTNAFINNKTLQSIDFSDNRLGYKATQYLAQAFRHDSVKSYWFSFRYSFLFNVDFDKIMSERESNW